ncbi:MAG: hypothetical protein EOS17_12005 [Mesorhizobium sp.]|nr:MAG: hypothetical protein EOS17_12005 [Mesorhizobium sp.]
MTRAQPVPRSIIPKRTAGVPAQARYGAYKPQLRQDFFQRCGYCDDWDRYYGGLPGYHVEHFAPKKKFPALERDYANLIYACPYCNRGKSDAWIGNDAHIPHNGAEGFVDPCQAEFDSHLTRDASGRFISLTPVGEYMLRKLRLHLERHRYIWVIQNLQVLRGKAEKLRHRVTRDHPDYVVILETLADLQTKIDEYNDSVFGAAA